MIEWEKFDPENPPKLFKNYLVYDRKKIVNARFDYSGQLSEKKVFWVNDDEGNIRTIHGVTHFAEINFPEE